MTPILQTLIPLVTSYGTHKAVQFLEGAEELAFADDDLTSFLARRGVEWDQLETADQDSLRDAYLEAIKLECARRLTNIPTTDHYTVSDGKALIDAQGLQYQTRIYTPESTSPASSPVPAPLVPEVVKVALEALEGLLKHVERQTCSHEETYRGGSIWTICSSCGMKWADDEGGMPKSFPTPKAVEKAESALSALRLLTAEGGMEDVHAYDGACFECGSTSPFIRKDGRIICPNCKTIWIPPILPPSSEGKEPGVSIGYLEPVQYEIIKELCRSFHLLGAPIGIQAALGSWGDTLTDEEVLELLQAENAQASTTPQKGGQGV